ncbi:MAG: LysM peptidoglycan-binding domain-containing protein, partial [Pseudomonadota bacterium]|nr:LysM peptidoglycan-binding domain-containing protein [Pseudomonadota bacterium]
PAVLPVPAPRPEHRQVHIIRRGETLQDVARRYRVDLMQLLSANGLASNRLRMPAGTSLTIPDGDI